jgi:hypothetical protein
MTENGYKTHYQSECPSPRKIRVSDDWFEVYEIARNLFAFCETRHFENTTISLMIGPQKAVLIDTVFSSPKKYDSAMPVTLGMAQETCCAAGFVVHLLPGRAPLGRTAQQQNAKRKSHDLEYQKYIDASFKPWSPVTGQHHEHVV